MKYIIKGDEPDSFTEWKNASNEDWQASYNDLSGQEKRDVKNALILEQGSICCYCEQKLIYNDSHIEHLNPQCQSSEGQLDFANMLCSCQQQLKKGEPLHCGNSKGDNYITVTPLQDNCANQFTYTEDGYIGYINNETKETIEILQLDIDKLNNMRAEAIEPFIIDPITFEEIGYDEAKLFAQKYLELNDGKYNEFYTTIKYLFLRDE